MAPLRSAYRPSMDAETRERPAALSLARGAPTASCLLLAGRSPGPAARSDADWFDPRGARLQRPHRCWTSVLKIDGARGHEHAVAADTRAIALPRTRHARRAAHGHTLLDRHALEAEALVQVRHHGSRRRARRRVLARALVAHHEAARVDAAVLELAVRQEQRHGVEAGEQRRQARRVGSRRGVRAADG